MKALQENPKKPNCALDSAFGLSGRRAALSLDWVLTGIRALVEAPPNKLSELGDTVQLERGGAGEQASATDPEKPFVALKSKL
jgi:hypothetical protein